MIASTGESADPPESGVYVFDTNTEQVKTIYQDLGIAKQKARMLAGNIQYLFRWLRDKGCVMSSLTDRQIQTMVNQYIREKLQSVEYNRAKYEFTSVPELIKEEEFLKDSLSDVLMDLQVTRWTVY